MFTHPNVTKSNAGKPVFFVESVHFSMLLLLSQSWVKESMMITLKCNLIQFAWFLVEFLWSHSLRFNRDEFRFFCSSSLSCHLLSHSHFPWLCLCPPCVAPSHICDIINEKQLLFPCLSLSCAIISGMLVTSHDCRLGDRKEQDELRGSDKFLGLARGGSINFWCSTGSQTHLQALIHVLFMPVLKLG